MERGHFSSCKNEFLCHKVLGWGGIQAGLCTLNVALVQALIGFGLGVRKILVLALGASNSRYAAVSSMSLDISYTFFQYQCTFGKTSETNFLSMLDLQ